MKFCPRCDDFMIKQFDLYGFYYYYKHCDYSIIDKEI